MTFEMALLESKLEGEEHGREKTLSQLPATKVASLGGETPNCLDTADLPKIVSNLRQRSANYRSLYSPQVVKRTAELYSKYFLQHLHRVYDEFRISDKSKNGLSK